MTTSNGESWVMSIFLLFCMMFVAASVSSAITASVHGPFSYSTGYCTALNGTRLNNETCDVDGKVVTVVTYDK